MEKNEQQIKKESEVKEPNQEKDESSYKDIHGISNNDLKVGFWYIEHFVAFKRFIVYFLLAVCVISWTYFLFGLMYYLVIGMKQDNDLQRELMLDYFIGHRYYDFHPVADLEIVSIEKLENTDGSNDLAILVSNDNDRYFARFELNLQSADKAHNETAYVYPGEEKYIIILKSVFSDSDEIDAMISNVKWRRVNIREIPDWQKFEDEHLKVEISNKNFEQDFSVNFTDSIRFNRLTFTARNNTAFNYRNMNFKILIKRNGAIIATNKYAQENFLSGRSYNIEIRWRQELDAVNDIEILPDIDILDRDSYLKFDQRQIKELDVPRNQDLENVLDYYR